MLNILFLCTGNSCRSILAEGLLNHYGTGRFKAYSAGSFPTGEVHPLSVTTLKKRGVSAQGYSSKSWDKFADMQIDIVITVCDAAAAETCPIFHGSQIKAHWGVSDPAKFEGSEEEALKEFSRICDILERRVKALVALPSEQLTKEKLNEIGML